MAIAWSLLIQRLQGSSTEFIRLGNCHQHRLRKDQKASLSLWLCPSWVIRVQFCVDQFVELWKNHFLQSNFVWHSPPWSGLELGFKWRTDCPKLWHHTSSTILNVVAAMPLTSGKPPAILLYGVQSIWVFRLAQGIVFKWNRTFWTIYDLLDTRAICPTSK